MCRYAWGQYKDHFVCLECRRAFKHPFGSQPRCPQCSKPMVSMGRDFEAPPRKDLQAWQVLRSLAAYGLLFHSCGCGGPGFRPRTLKELGPFLREQGH